jgi:hypothetical protein
MVMGAVGLGLLASRIVAATIVADSALPQWIMILGILGMPIVGLLGILFTFFHLGAKVDHVKHEVGGKVDILEIKINSKMDRLLNLTEIASHAAGLLEGRAQVIAETNTIAAQHMLDEALRAQGADALRAAQQTPSAPPTDRP